MVSQIPLHSRLRRLAAAFAITLSLLMLPVSPATAAGPINIENVYTTQARTRGVWSDDDTITLRYRLTGSSTPWIYGNVR